jgi:large subunit ribosomal protein L23
MAKALHPLALLEDPMVTEKGTRLSDENKYLFQVHPWANKQQIRGAVEMAFNVHVVKVNIVSMKGKPRRARNGRRYHESNWKKAIVTLAEGDDLKLFEGV